MMLLIWSHTINNVHSPMFLLLLDIQDPSICDVYADHSYPATVAQYAPSGFYIASGGKLTLSAPQSKNAVCANIKRSRYFH